MRASIGAVLAGAFVLAAQVGLSQAAPPDTPCVDVQVGNEHVPDLDCINRQFRLRAERAHDAPVQLAPIGAGSPSTAVGTANQAAAEEKMGSAFGKSAQPQRPQQPTFVSPLVKPPGGH